VISAASCLIETSQEAFAKGCGDGTLVRRGDGNLNQYISPININKPGSITLYKFSIKQYNVLTV